MATEKRVIILDVQVTRAEAEKSLKSINAELVKQRQELSDLNKAYKEGIVSEAQYGKETLRLRGEIKETSREQRAQQKILRNLDTETDELAGSNNQLRATLSRLTTQYNKLGKAERQSTDEGKELTQQIRNISNELKKNEKAIGDNRRNVGNYSDALGNLNIGILDNIGSLAGPGGLVAAIGLGVTAIKEGIQFVSDLTTEFVKLRGETQRLTGETGENLDELVIKIKSVSEVFEQDYNEVLIASNALAKQFGIAQIEAAELIETGFLTGANASGEFLSILEEYPTQLRAVGLSAEESIAIISQQVKSGVYTDKGIDTIKEAGLRLRELPEATEAALEGIGLSSDEIQKALTDGTKSIFEVIQDVSGALGELPANSKEVGTAIADIFGGPGEDAGLNYLLTLQDVSLELDGLIDDTNTLTQAQQQQLQATEELTRAENELSKVFEDSSGELDILITQGKTFLIEALIPILQGLKDNIDEFKTLIKWIGRLSSFLQKGTKRWNDFRESIGLARRDVEETTGVGKRFVNILKLITGVGIGDFLKSLGQDFINLGQDILSLFNKAKELSNTFLGTDFEVDIDTSKAKMSLEELANLPLPEPEPPTLRGYAAKFEEVEEEITKKTQKEAQKRNDIALKERIAGIELQLLAVEKGGNEELELQKDLIDAKTELAISGTKNQVNQQLLIQRKAQQDQLALESKFIDETAKNSQKILQSKQDDLLKGLANQILADSEIIASDNLLKQNKIASSQEVLAAQTNALALRAEQERLAALISGEISNQTTKDQIDDIKELLKSDTISTEDREALARRLAQLQKQLSLEVLESSRDIINSISSIATNAAAIFEAQKQKELEAAKDNEAEQAKINEKFAKREKKLAVFQALLGASLAIIQVLANKTLLPEPIGTIQKIASGVAIGAAAFNALAQIKAASFKDGGLLKGASHENGGIPIMRNGRQIAEAEGGEYFINKKATARNTPLLDRINTEGVNRTIPMPSFAFGGALPTFQDGGISTQENRTAIQQQTEPLQNLERAIEDLQLFVSVKEINDVDTRVKAKERNSSL